MAKIKDSGEAFTIWISAVETADWAKGLYGNGTWPCSLLADSRLRATFDIGGLLEYTVNGKDFGPRYEIGASEFNACVSDFARKLLAKEHPCYFVAVGQFK